MHALFVCARVRSGQRTLRPVALRPWDHPEGAAMSHVVYMVLAATSKEVENVIRYQM